MPEPSHKSVVQQSFTLQAQAYAVAPVVTDPERLQRLVEAVAPAADARVLDVATGPGVLALAFAERCREAVGIDLTDAPLSIAEKNRRERGLTNARFERGDAEHLPFTAGDFDVAVCRLAFHHFEQPLHVLREMARVCRPNGKIAVEDLISSEHRARSDYFNQFERLRDPSHVRALPPSELIALFTAAGLEIERMYSLNVVQNVERWLATCQTPSDRAAEVRAMIERDAHEDLSGARPYEEGGEWFFRQVTLTVVGRKLSS